MPRALAAALAAMLSLPLAVVAIFASIGGADPDPTFTASTGTPAGGGLRADAPVPRAYQARITQAGSLCPAITPALIAAQLQQESGWDPAAVSPTGAQGLAQFMPATWTTWAVDGDSDGHADPFDPADAIPTQGRYMCALAADLAGDADTHRLAGDVVTLALAAYNAGPGAVRQWHGVPPYPETRQYVAAITRLAAKYATIPDAPTGAGPGGAVLSYARQALGTPYSWGGGTYNGPSAGTSGTIGFDCSGLALYAWYQATGGRVQLPHHATDQARLGRPVPRGHEQPGDLLFFHNPADPPGEYHHVGIYAGHGQMIHAPDTGENVELVDLWTSTYWTRQYAAARRY